MCEIVWMIVENKIAIKILADIWGLLNLDCMLKYEENTLKNMKKIQFFLISCHI